MKLPPLTAFNDLPVEHRSPAFVLVDASAVLPRRADKRYLTRDPHAISEIVLHQTQGGTKPGREGLLATGAFFVADDDPTTRELEGRGWPGFAYTFFVPFTPELDVVSRAPVIYRCQPDNIRSYHTRHRADVGVGVAFQGFFRCKTAPHKGTPSPDQQRVVRPLLEYLLARYGLDRFDLFGHSDFGKADCPGFDLEAIIAEQRLIATQLSGKQFKTELEQQRVLASVGLMRARSVDGEANEQFRLAIERLQRAHDYPITGTWTRPVDTFVRRLLNEDPEEHTP